MKCPDCTKELKKIPDIYFASQCDNCNMIWLIQTFNQTYQMGLLNTELLSRTDLTTSEKTNLLMEKAKELEKNR